MVNRLDLNKQDKTIFKENFVSCLKVLSVSHEHLCTINYDSNSIKNGADIEIIQKDIKTKEVTQKIYISFSDMTFTESDSSELFFNVTDFNSGLGVIRVLLSAIEDEYKYYAAIYLQQEEYLSYAREFFKELCSLLYLDMKGISPEILPIEFAPEDDKSHLEGSFNVLEKQHVIRLDWKRFIDTEGYFEEEYDEDFILAEKERKDENLRTIRHEVLHYYLYVADLPFKDDSLLFWLYCKVFDGRAYKKLSNKDNQVYKAFEHTIDNIDNSNDRRILIKRQKKIILLQNIQGVISDDNEYKKDELMEMINRMN